VMTSRSSSFMVRLFIECCLQLFHPPYDLPSMPVLLLYTLSFLPLIDGMGKEESSHFIYFLEFTDKYSTLDRLHDGSFYRCSPDTPFLQTILVKQTPKCSLFLDN